MNIKPLNNNILFQFLDHTGGAKGKFTDRITPSGIVIPTLDSAQKLPRWGKVVALGPKAAEAGLSVGDFILIEALMWSFGTEVDGVKMWKTDDSKVLMVTDDEEETKGTSF